MEKSSPGFTTEAIRTQADPSDHREHSVPIYATSSFTYESAEEGKALFAGDREGYIYSRYSNPNNVEFVNKMKRLEKMDAGVSTASGMAAVFASLAGILTSGDHVLASRSLFGSSHQILDQILPNWNIGHSYVNLLDPVSWEKQIKNNTKMVFVETPTNPTLDLVDLERLGIFARDHNLHFNVDNTFATPYLQNPSSYGADIVTHSCSKFIDGQGRTIGGAVLGTTEVIDKIQFFTRHTGPALSPFNGWLLSKSLETLAVRMDAHCRNALALTEYLAASPHVTQVKYPYHPSHPQFALAKRQMRSGGGVVTFEIKEGLNRAGRFLNSLEMISLTANLGDSRTIATHPASTTHSKLSEKEREAAGITRELLRLSVGLESISDIVGDVDRALAASA